MLSRRWGGPCRFQGACAAHPVLPFAWGVSVRSRCLSNVPIVIRCTEIVVKECHRPFPPVL
ncbi:hypothetical protein BLAT2472_60330 [Burkholderia latens]